MLFRTFPYLRKLQFYLCLFQNNLTQPNDLFLLSFQSGFWHKRSIRVAAHVIHGPRRRYVYTVPFAFDQFDLLGNFSSCFVDAHAHDYTNVRHLSLMMSVVFVEHIYVSAISKCFLDLRTITLCDESAKQHPSDFLEKYDWICQK